jgi:hypothetical protein
VIPDEPEAAAAVDQLADEQLPGSQVVTDELDALPGTFEPGELPEAMAHGAFGGKSGLVVLTDRRLLFVSKQAAGEEFVELPRAKLEAAEARSSFLGNTGLRVQYDGRRFDFKGIEPKQRAGEIADLLDDVS